MSGDRRKTGRSECFMSGINLVPSGKRVEREQTMKTREAHHVQGSANLANCFSYRPRSMGRGAVVDLGMRLGGWIE